MEKFLTKKPGKQVFLINILLLTVTSLLSAQNSDNLFQSVFGELPDSVQVFPVPLFVNNQYIFDLSLYSDALNDHIDLEARKLLDFLKPRLQSITYENLETETKKNEDIIALNTLNEMGLETYYDNRELALFIDIPPELQQELFVDMRKNDESLLGTIVKPSPVSAYINMFSSLNLNISGNNTDRDILVPLSIGLDSAVNIHSFVLEGDILFNYIDTLSVSDWNARFVKDITEGDLRIKGGTVSYSVTQLQGYVPLTGITIGRNFNLNPYNNIQSLGSQSIILQSSSEVEVLVNGRLLKKLKLPKGRYKLENLQLDSGANFVEIKIKEISGEEKSLIFSQPFNINILKKGLLDFASVLGMYENEMDSPYISGYFRYGLTDIFTIGANLQSDFSMFNSGLTFLLGTIGGNFSLEGSVSHDNGLDWAFSFFYRYINSRFPHRNNWSFSLTYRGENYSGLRLEKVRNTTPLRLSLYYGQILPGNINGGLTVSRDFLSGWTGGNTELSLHLSRHFTNSLLMNLFINGKFSDEGDSDFSAGLTLTVNLQEKNETLTTSASWPGTAIESSWQKSSASRIPGYSLNAGLSGVPAPAENAPYGFSLGGEYRGYKFTGSVNHSSSFLNTNDISLHNSSLNFNSALVYADSTMAFTRPVYDSFVIIRPGESFQDYSIGINPEGKSYAALLSGRGKAVLPDFNSYRNGRIYFEAIDLPVGYDIGNSVFTYLPEYKSGTVITVGSEAVVFAGGHLIDERGEFLPLSAFAVGSLDNDFKEEKMFFTNRDGYFEIYGLSEGEWIIELLEDRDYKAYFTIPQGSFGYYELWNVELKKEGNK
ncbi:MAG: fimbrial biogenesis outer membrane usher protein [Spirochaetaceae bacterium]|nr:fimbrial biogenesis outer membrane usher protein [Spirochaetaceae bacterium]